MANSELTSVQVAAQRVAHAKAQFQHVLEIRPIAEKPAMVAAWRNELKEAEASLAAVILAADTEKAKRLAQTAAQAALASREQNRKVSADESAIRPVK